MANEEQQEAHTAEEFQQQHEGASKTETATATSKGAATAARIYSEMLKQQMKGGGEQMSYLFGSLLGFMLRWMKGIAIGFALCALTVFGIIILVGISADGPVPYETGGGMYRNWSVARDQYKWVRHTNHPFTSRETDGILWSKGREYQLDQRNNRWYMTKDR